jgi:hypothetical protein
VLERRSCCARDRVGSLARPQVRRPRVTPQEPSELFSLPRSPSWPCREPHLHPGRCRRTGPPRQWEYKTPQSRRDYRHTGVHAVFRSPVRPECPLCLFQRHVDRVSISGDFKPRTLALQPVSPATAPVLRDRRLPQQRRPSCDRRPHPGTAGLRPDLRPERGLYDPWLSPSCPCPPALRRHLHHMRGLLAKRSALRPACRPVPAPADVAPKPAGALAATKIWLTSLRRAAGQRCCSFRGVC